MKINKWYWNSLSSKEKERIVMRSENDIADITTQISPILEKVKREGDNALFHYNTLFDKAPDKMPLKVSEKEFAEAEKLIADDVKEALNYCIENVRRFHISQKPESINLTEIRPGLFAGEKATPIDSVGLYVPRGRGSFPSMLYMLAVPAVVAEVPLLCIVTPPDKNGKADPACLVTARLCGISDVYKIGGAHAVAALTYGTESIPAVCKITGPGSRYVAAAKQLLGGKVDTGLPAGPSESIILADKDADPRKVALDLMIEAEHGSDSAALLVTSDEKLADKCISEIKNLTESLPAPRKGFLKDVFSGYGGIIISRNDNESAEICNIMATEHLQIQSRSPFDFLGKITNAGEILLGENTPFSLANYGAGPNAVLPTGGKAKTWSAVSVRDFIKYSSVIYCTEQGYDNLKGPVVTLAEYEGFVTHADAFKKRN